jgi:hypothetical protein
LANHLENGSYEITSHVEVDKAILTVTIDPASIIQAYVGNLDAVTGIQKQVIDNIMFA